MEQSPASRRKGEAITCDFIFFESLILPPLTSSYHLAHYFLTVRYGLANWSKSLLRSVIVFRKFQPLLITYCLIKTITDGPENERVRSQHRTPEKHTLTHLVEGLYLVGVIKAVRDSANSSWSSSTRRAPYSRRQQSFSRGAFHNIDTIPKLLRILSATAACCAPFLHGRRVREPSATGFFAMYAKKCFRVVQRT